MTSRLARSSRANEAQPRGRRRFGAGLYLFFAAALSLAGFLLSVPFFLTWEARYEGAAVPNFFPVTVDPAKKTIAEDPAVETLFSGSGGPFAAAALEAAGAFAQLAAAVASLPLYEALYAGGDRYVVIPGGFRKEQVADAFASTLRWNAASADAFFADSRARSEGTLTPGTYAVPADATPADAERALAERFDREVLSRYATSTANIVPLSEALTLASLIERETKDKDEMRVVAGVLWNRMFAGMKLQVDPTVQYAKANQEALRQAQGHSTGLPRAPAEWWPAVYPHDLSIKSPYNTYAHAGLPPTPIAEPSVYAILAALNPKKTSCLYYFHDRYGGFHCSDTYQNHVALLKKYYGRGK